MVLTKPLHRKLRFFFFFCLEQKLNKQLSVFPGVNDYLFISLIFHLLITNSSPKSYPTETSFQLCPNATVVYQLHSL